MTGKQVMLKVRDYKPISATVMVADQIGVWVKNATALTAYSGLLQKTAIHDPIFLLPWTSVDWVVMQAE